MDLTRSGLQESVFMSDLQPAIRDHLIQSCDRTERFSSILLSIRDGTFLISLFACVFALFIANFTKRSSIVLGSGLRIIRRSAANCYAN